MCWYSLKTSHTESPLLPSDQGKSKELKAWSDDGPAVVKGGHYVLAHSHLAKFGAKEWDVLPGKPSLLPEKVMIIDEEEEDEEVESSLFWTGNVFSWTLEYHPRRLES